jgi:hypothetical protein
MIETENLKYYIRELEETAYEDHKKEMLKLVDGENWKDGYLEGRMVGMSSMADKIIKYIEKDSHLDFYLKNRNVINRLYQEWAKYGRIIIAYDFDETIYDFHGKGHKFDEVINLLKECKKYGANFIVFTCREKIDEPFIINYLNEIGLPYDKINENMDYISYGGRKIYYNIFLDDRAGLQSAYDCLSYTLNLIKNLKGEQK